METYNTAQVREFARRDRDGKSLDSWERAALTFAKSQQGEEGRKLQRIVEGKEE